MKMHMNYEKKIIWTAKLVSMLFNPFYLALSGLIILFLFSNLRYLPWSYQLNVLFMVYLFTILFPTMLIRLYRRYQGWNLMELGRKERRMVPYIISILCYLTCYYVMSALRMPHFMGSILLSALMIQVLCALINVWWKISTHSAAIGGVAGALIAFSVFFFFNPIWWLCLVILLAGVVGSARMILRQHTLPQVVSGFLLGFCSALFVVLFF
jgi:membrane-associated phospholipid phosphatase